MILAVLHQKGGVGKTTLGRASGDGHSPARRPGVAGGCRSPGQCPRLGGRALQIRIWSARGSGRAQAQAEINLPEQILTEDVKVLFGQLVQQIFINSGGARYLSATLR